MFTVVSALFRLFFKLFGVVPSAPTTISVHFPKPLEFPCQILVFTHFLLLLLNSCVSRHCNIYQECRLVVLYDYNISRLCSITWSIWILTSKRMLTFSISITGSAVCRYHYFERGRPYFPHRLKRTIPATLSCLFLYSSCASLLHHSLSARLSHALAHFASQIAFLFGLSFFTLTTLVLNAWSYAAIRNRSVSFFRFLVSYFVRRTQYWLNLRLYSPQISF